MAETNMPKHAKTNMPKHGSGPPETFSEIKLIKTCLQTACQKCLKQQDSKHAKSCQDTTCQTYRKKQASKHGSRPPEGKSKAIVAAHAQITNALHCVTRNILCTKHAKSCQDTTCQHISRKTKGIKHVSRPPERSTISYSNRSLRRQAVESNCRV